MTYSKIDYGHGGCGAANPAAFICPRLRLFKSAPGVPGMIFLCGKRMTNIRYDVDIDNLCIKRRDVPLLCRLRLQS